MNKQSGPNAIEYCDWTSNPLGGCPHGCEWDMPDGKVARCYAEAVAEGLAKGAYPDGFNSVYWREGELARYAKLKEPARIFIGSMADVFAGGMPDPYISEILKVCAANPQHTFLFLTKNVGRLKKFAGMFRQNMWVGVSSPPDRMQGVEIDNFAKLMYMKKALDVLDSLEGKCVRWISFEPLSWDAHNGLYEWQFANGLYWDVPLPFDWAVIGAASNGPVKYQPEKQHVFWLLECLNDWDIPVFMKNNLEWEPRRTEYPV